MTSIIGSYYTLSACIDKIPNMENTEWKAKNDKQELYLKIYENCKNAKIPEIESKVSIGDVSPVNAFLRERGFDIQLDPLDDPRDLAIASVLEVLLKWIEEGKKRPVVNDDIQYKGVRLEAGVSIVNVNGFLNPVAIIKTKNGDKVYMTIPSEAPRDSFEVFELAQKITTSFIMYADNYEDVIFPMIDLNTQPDISWLIGMCDKNEEFWSISQALQQTIVKMDEKGVLIKEAVALGVRCMAASFPTTQPLVIDKPFLFVVERDGLKEPLFSAYLDIDGWIRK